MSQASIQIESKNHYGSDEPNIVRVLSDLNIVEVVISEETKLIARLELHAYNNMAVFDLQPILSSIFPQEKDNFRYNAMTDLPTKTIKIEVANATQTSPVQIVTYKGKSIAKNLNNSRPLFSGFPQCYTFIDYINAPYNKLKRTPINRANYNAYDINARITRIIDEEGIYVKWFNELGSWSYWLFDGVFEETIKAKSGAVIQNPFFKKTANDKKETIEALPSHISKQWKLSSVVPAFPDELEELLTLLRSNQIYLFLGRKRYQGERDHSYVEPNLWQRVYLLDTSSKYTINKQGTYNFEVTINFPDNE